MSIGGIIVLVIILVVIWALIDKFWMVHIPDDPVEKMQEMTDGEKAYQKYVSSPAAKKIIKSAKLLGVTTATDSRELAYDAQPRYSVLVTYASGDTRIVECDAKEMKQYLPYIHSK